MENYRGACSSLVWIGLIALLLACGDDDEGPGPASDAAGQDGQTDVGNDTGISDGGADDTRPGDETGRADGVEDLAPSVSVTVAVGDVFPAGTALRDGYAGATAVVGDDGRVTIDAHPNGVLLLERDTPPGAEADFTWDNVTVYFVITDRFENGDPGNDHSYGREAATGEEIGTWHGGDLVGLTNRLDYLDELGVNAIWITAPYEQVHGYVGGGSAGQFQYFAYHGYWALDYTRLDANMGTLDELEAFISAAHERGIRVIFDVVMNHPGYGTMADLDAYLPEVLSDGWENWSPGEGQNWYTYNDLFIDFTSSAWTNWWGPSWIRSDLPGYPRPGTDNLTRTMEFLPDFRTESTEVLAGLPTLLQRKDDTDAVVIPGATVRDYLVTWLTDWVGEYGVDGFRCDTAKHVELAAWAELHAAGVAALREWKTAHPEDALDDLDFWMTGEVFPHGVTKDAYFTEGEFDSLINFDFKDAAQAALDDLDALDATYASYASAINGDPDFNVLSYLSSHDTSLFFEDVGRDIQSQYRAGTILLMAPGGVQIFYGDETARPLGPNEGSAQQGTRSDMNWNEYDAGLLAHWRRLGQFRRRHAAVGAGSHRRLSFDGGYAFAREYTQGDVDDAVVVVLFEAP